LTVNNSPYSIPVSLVITGASPPSPTAGNIVCTTTIPYTIAANGSVTFGAATVNCPSVGVLAIKYPGSKKP